MDLFLNGEENAKEKSLNRMKGGKDGTKNFVRENDQEKLERIWEKDKGKNGSFLKGEKMQERAWTDRREER